jgi:hypothetical protein
VLRCAAATAAYPDLRLRAVSPETELDSRALRRRAAVLGSAALRRAGSAIPKVLVLRPLAVRTAVALESALLRVGWATPEAIVWRPAVVGEMARSSAEFAVQAPRSAGPVVSAAQAAALPLEGPAAWDAVEAPQQEAAAWDAAVVPQQVAVWVGAAEPPQEAAARGGVEVPQPEAVARASVEEEAARRQEARDAAAVPLRGAVLRAVSDARAARPSAVPWVFRRDQALPWPAPQPAVWFARATQCLRIALP